MTANSTAAHVGTAIYHVKLICVLDTSTSSFFIKNVSLCYQMWCFESNWNLQHYSPQMNPISSRILLHLQQAGRRALAGLLFHYPHRPQYFYVFIQCTGQLSEDPRVVDFSQKVGGGAKLPSQQGTNQKYMK